jgi:hypothetical protein
MQSPFLAHWIATILVAGTVGALIVLVVVRIIGL